MKQDYGMFFACFLTYARPPTWQHACFSTSFFFRFWVRFSLLLVTCLIFYLMSQITFKLGYFFCLFPMHHTTRPYLVILYQFQLIGLFPVRAGFSIMTGKHVDSAHVCFSITCYKNADGLYLRVYCTKNEGGKTVCAIKNTKIQFHTCDLGPIHISRVWYT